MKKLKLSDRQKIIYGSVIFVLALIVSVVAFSNAILGMGMKEPGYYTIETDTVSDAVNYASGYEFVCYLDGSTDEIKTMAQLLRSEYSGVLSRVYKLTDNTAAYEGFVNIFTLNESVGKEVAISREMYAILSDALEKTREEKGYSLFAGNLNKLWMDILVLRDPEDFDPTVNADMANLISDLSLLSADLSNFGLELNARGDQYTCKLTVSQAYQDFLTKNELTPCVLDLGALRDSYILQQIAAEMEEKQHTNGYLTSKTGLAVSLSGYNEKASYQVYGMGGEEPVKYATVSMDKGTAYCSKRCFPLNQGELGYYSVQADGQTLYRHPLVPVSGYYQENLQSVCAVAGDGDVVAAAYSAIRMFAARESELASLAESMNVKLVCVLRSAPDSLYVNTLAAKSVASDKKLFTFAD